MSLKPLGPGLEPSWPKWESSDLTLSHLLVQPVLIWMGWPGGLLQKGQLSHHHSQLDGARGRTSQSPRSAVWSPRGEEQPARPGRWPGAPPRLCPLAPESASAVPVRFLFGESPRPSFQALEKFREMWKEAAFSSVGQRNDSFLRLVPAGRCSWVSGPRAGFPPSGRSAGFPGHGERWQRGSETPNLQARMLPRALQSAFPRFLAFCLQWGLSCRGCTSLSKCRDRWRWPTGGADGDIVQGASRNGPLWPLGGGGRGWAHDWLTVLPFTETPAGVCTQGGLSCFLGEVWTTMKSKIKHEGWLWLRMLFQVLWQGGFSCSGFDKSITFSLKCKKEKRHLNSFSRTNPLA